MTRVKICGITTLEDALVAVRAGAHALGFVFADSPRCVKPGNVRQIVGAIPPFVTTVGVFVDEPLERVQTTLCETGVQLAQFHGRETPDYCAAFGRPAIKRFRIGEQSSAETIRSELNHYDVAGYLLDPGAGSGRRFDWVRIAELGGAGSTTLGSLGRYLIVAGGLSAENVGDAITLLRPHAVDVCTGVEKVPGRKDAREVRAFIQAVEQANAFDAA